MKTEEDELNTARVTSTSAMKFLEAKIKAEICLDAVNEAIKFRIIFR